MENIIPKPIDTAQVTNMMTNTIFGFSSYTFQRNRSFRFGRSFVMPTSGELNLEPGLAEEPGSGYHSQFSHENEHAEPGYYSVILDDYYIQAELTASDRVGFHRYTLKR